MAITRRRVMLGSGVLALAAPLAACGPRGRRPAASSSEPATTAPPKDPGTPLVIGSIGTASGLPSTFEKQIQIAIGEARTDVNIGGGVFGKDVTLLPREVIPDPGADLAPVIQKLRDAGATAIITSCGDDALRAAVPAFVDAGVLVVSVDSTARDLRADDVDTAGMLIRLAPTDTCFAPALAESAWTADRDTQPGLVHVLGRDTMAGRSLVEELRLHLEPRGGQLVPALFPAGAPDLGGPIDAIIQTPPALVVIDAGEETPQIITAIAQKNLDADGRPRYDIPLRTTFYNSRAWGDQVPVDAMTHLTGSRPGAPPPDALINTMLNIDPSLVGAGFDFSGAAYDAVVLLALAAQTAHSAEGSQIAAALPSLLVEGEDVSDFDAARRLLAEGARIRYHGRYGKLELAEDGDPSVVELTAITYAENGQVAGENSTDLERG